MCRFKSLFVSSAVARTAATGCLAQGILSE